jgi:hypothetical protein
MGEMRNVYKVLIRTPEGKALIGRPKHRWEDNIKIGLRDLGCEGVCWIHLARDRNRWRALVNTVIKVRVPYNSVNFLAR